LEEELQWNRPAVVPVFHLSAHTATLVLSSSVLLFSVLVLLKLKRLGVSQSDPFSFDHGVWSSSIITGGIVPQRRIIV
jgi:hypothetical protein